MDLESQAGEGHVVVSLTPLEFTRRANWRVCYSSRALRSSSAAERHAALCNGVSSPPSLVLNLAETSFDIQTVAEALAGSCRATGGLPQASVSLSGVIFSNRAAANRQPLAVWREDAIARFLSVRGSRLRAGGQLDAEGAPPSGVWSLSPKGDIWPRAAEILMPHLSWTPLAAREPRLRSKSPGQRHSSSPLCCCPGVCRPKRRRRGTARFRDTHRLPLQGGHRADRRNPGGANHPPPRMDPSRSPRDGRLRSKTDTAPNSLKGSGEEERRSGTKLRGGRFEDRHQAFRHIAEQGGTERASLSSLLAQLLQEFA